MIIDAPLVPFERYRLQSLYGPPSRNPDLFIVLLVQRTTMRPLATLDTLDFSKSFTRHAGGGAYEAYKTLACGQG